MGTQYIYPFFVMKDTYLFLQVQRVQSGKIESGGGRVRKKESRIGTYFLQPATLIFLAKKKSSKRTDLANLRFFPNPTSVHQSSGTGKLFLALPAGRRFLALVGLSLILIDVQPVVHGFGDGRGLGMFNF